MRNVLRYTTDREIVAKFKERVEQRGPDDCWPFRTVRPDKYGELCIGRIRIGAHRFAYAFHNATDPGELLVCHTCDNPPCCNPAHLFLGTVQDNSLDMVAKGRDRQGPSKGSQNGYAKLTEADVRDIRAQIGAGKNNCQIARRYGVTHQMISKIRLGHFWKHVSDEPETRNNPVTTKEQIVAGKVGKG